MGTRTGNFQLPDHLPARDPWWKTGCTQQTTGVSSRGGSSVYWTVNLEVGKLAGYPNPALASPKESPGWNKNAGSWKTENQTITPQGEDANQRLTNGGGTWHICDRGNSNTSMRTKTGWNVNRSWTTARYLCTTSTKKWTSEQKRNKCWWRSNQPWLHWGS